MRGSFRLVPLLLWWASVAHAQPLFSVEVTTSPQPIFPDTTLTLAVRVTNTSSADLSNVFVGLVQPDLTTYLTATTPPGTVAARFPRCSLAVCNPEFIGFSLPVLDRGASASMTLDVKMLATPGATIEITGLAASPSLMDLTLAPGEITIGGSIVLPTQQSSLIVTDSAATDVFNFLVTGAVFEPGSGNYLVGGTRDWVPSLAVVNSSGVVTASIFNVGPTTDVFMGQGPQLAYSDQLSPPGSGRGVMMIWNASTSPLNELGLELYTRVVKSDLVTHERVQIGVGLSPGIAYSQTDHLFLATWLAPFDGRLRARRVGLDGQPVGAELDLGATHTYTQHSSAWNPLTNEFGIATIIGDVGPEPYTVAFLRLSADGTVLSHVPIARVRPNHDSRPVLSLNTRTGHYIILWPDRDMFGAEIDYNGQVVSRGLIARQLSNVFSVAYNGMTDTFLAAVADSFSGDISLIELNPHGAPLSAPFEPGPKMWLPTVSARSDAPLWRVFGNVPHSPVSSTFGSMEIGSTVPGGCRTPDPFVALSRGTCVNGGWFPPGMGTPAPTPPPPTPTPGGCITPDPFVALGGGTCVNGGWYPPGMATPAPTPPPPTPAPGGCITPDPFVALGGGRCINGGWYPPGMGGS